MKRRLRQNGYWTYAKIAESLVGNSIRFCGNGVSLRFNHLMHFVDFL